MHALGKIPKYRNTMKKGHTGQFYRDLLKVQKIIDRNGGSERSLSTYDGTAPIPSFQGITVSRQLSEEEHAYALHRSSRD